MSKHVVNHASYNLAQLKSLYSEYLLSHADKISAPKHLVNNAPYTTSAQLKSLYFVYYIIYMYISTDFVHIIQLISSVMGFVVQKVYDDGMVAFQPRSQGFLRENPGNKVGSFHGYG